MTLLKLIRSETKLMTMDDVMSNENQINEQSNVVMHFAVKLDADQIIDSTFDKKPASFKMGDGNLLPGFEKHLMGMRAGDQNEFVIKPEDGFGQSNPNNLQIFMKSFFICFLIYDINIYIIMTIKSSQTLVSEALEEIKTISTDDAHKMFSDNQCNLIDIRDIRELQKEGQVEGANHIPRGMLEFWIDPKSPYYKDYFNSKNKFIFYCASGWRSSLSSKTALEMGLINVLNLENGIDDWIKQNGPIEKITIKKN